MKLAYEIFQAANHLPKIVFLHGLGGYGKLWRPIVAPLQQYASIMTVDQRGHGDSRFTISDQGFGPLDYGQDLLETLKTTFFTPTWCIGHSMGVRSAVAASFLDQQNSSQNSLIQGLILVDLGFTGLAGGGLGLALQDFLQKLPKYFPSSQLANQFLQSHCPDESMARYLAACLKQETTSQRWVFPFDHEALIKTLQQATPIQPWIEVLAKAQKPILVLRGALSRVWSQDDFLKTQKFFTSYPHLMFKEIPDAGHGLPFEQRASFIQVILDFIHSHDSI